MGIVRTLKIYVMSMCMRFSALKILAENKGRIDSFSSIKIWIKVLTPVIYNGDQF